ncbi:MAG: VanW family protein [Firmicutes bacterium]|nr:VanW family protein [Bacillota bacterium]
MRARFPRSTPYAATLVLAAAAVLVFLAKPLSADSADKGYLYMYAEERVWEPSEHPSVIVRGRGATRVDLTVWRFNPTSQYRAHGSLHSAVEALSQGGAVLVKRLTEYPRPKKRGGDFTLRVSVPADRVAGYVIKARDSQGREDATWILVTDLGLVTKQAQDKLLVYAHTFTSDAPCEGAKVSVYSEGKEVGSGTTGRDGLWVLNAPGLPKGLSVVGIAGESFAQVTSSYYWEDSRYKAYIYTDRPIYRPGQRVFFKGILREEADGDYKVLAGEPVRVEVRDARDACIYKAGTTTSTFGSFTGELVLGDEPALGTYRVLATVRGSTHSGMFKVAEYRKPEYQVQVEAPKTTYVAGDEIPVSVEATYYFGAPVPGAKVKYAAYSQPHYFSYYSFEDLGYYPVGDEDFGYYGELVMSGESVTDSGGRVSFTIKTQRADTTRRMFIEAVVVDESRREVTGRTSVIVARGLFDVSVQPAAYVIEPGKPAMVKVKAETIEGKPLATRLEWQAMRQTWEDRKARRWKEASGGLRTAADGKGSFEFTPREEGSYVVEVAGTDGRGNRIASEAYLWVTSGAGRWPNYGGTEVEIVTDKDVYEVGDTAKILVNTTFDDAWAVVAVEGRDITSHEVVRITGHTRLFEVPVTREHMPNAFFTVTMVRGKRLFAREKTIYVSTRDNYLNVAIISNKETYGPGEKATYVVKTTDAAGRPVQSEVSLGVVDASIYAIQPEMAPDIEKAFYGSIWNRVVTNYSFPEWYYGGADKGGASADVRKKFEDTAFWNPTIVTDRNGTGKIEFTMPDNLTTWRATARAHTLRTQVGSATRDVVTAKDLVVRLATPRFFTLGDRTCVTTIVHNYTGRRITARVALEAEGITLKDAGERTVELDPMGQALLDWKVECGEVGVARFVASALGDGGQARDALELGVPVLAFGVRHEWHEAGEVGGHDSGAGGAGGAAGAGGTGGAGGADTDAGYGKAKAVVQFDVPAEALAGTVSVRVRLAPSVAAAALGALEYLASFPYGCVEQTMNSFLPDVVVARTLRDLGVKAPEIEEDLPKMVSAGLARLYRYQHYDGGWGWWEYDETDPRMTAYVVYGLDLARKAGFEVDEQVLARGKRALAELVNKPRNVDDLVYKLYVMSEVGARSLPRLDEMVARRLELSEYSLALLALTLRNVGRADDARLVLRDLLASARGDDIRTYWDAPGGERYWADNRVETTAYALMALLAVDPRNEKIPGVVRWLADARQGKAWFSTKDTAVAVFALAEYLKLRDEVAPNYTAAVGINGKDVGKLRFTRKDVFEKEAEVIVDARDLVRGRNELTISKDGGKGRLYYTFSCEYYTAAESVAPEGQGITVTRGYYRRAAARPAGATGTGREARGDGRAQGSGSGGGDGDAGAGSEEGTGYVYEPVAGPVKPGEEIYVRISIKADNPYRYVIIEDPLPSGFEASDEPIDGYSWDFWYGRKEVHDEKVVFFSGHLKEGENEIVYPIRAERPGDYRVMPTRVWGMYSPDVFGQSASSKISCAEPVLASFSTTLKDPEKSRNHNVALAAAAVDGVVLQPGEEFSFDRVVGPRLAEAGYREARVISGGKSVPGIGGGICQVSTTLYNVALLAGLEIVERHPHSRPVDYVPPGLDATVAEGQYDLRFRNTLGVPLALSARVDGTRLVMEARAPLADAPDVRVTTEVQETERPRLIGGVGAGASGAVAEPGGPAYGGESGIRVAVWRSFSSGGETTKELVSEDYYKPVHAVASSAQ